MQKFKVGDKVKQKKDSLFYYQSEEQIGVLEKDKYGDGQWYVVKWEDGNLKTYKSEYLILIEEKKEVTFMSKIKTFIKNVTLTSDEKLLRKHGLKTECGDYTEEAKEAVINKLVSENEAFLIEIAKGIELEEEKSK